jgi:hypothetical protein
MFKPKKGYCFKCKRLQSVTEVTYVHLDNGRRQLKGLCKACNTKVSSYV